MVARRSAANSPADLTFSQIVDICSSCNWSNEHRKGVRASLNSFYEFCVANGFAAHNPAAAMPRVPGDKPRPRPCPDDIWRELLDQAEPRERLMARLAGEAGLRRAEVAVCNISDLSRGYTSWELLVNGKGGKQRVLPLTDDLACEILRHAGGRSRGYLFPGQIDGHISAHHVGKIISRLMPEGWSMHKLRHRFATRGFAGTGDIMAVRDALGHSSVATTQIYTAVAANGVRAVTDAAAWLRSTHASEISGSSAARGGGRAGLVRR